MPKISPDQREERRLQILEAAWRCFSRNGLHETTMHDIIGEAGLSAGAVYLYFSSKQEIILTAIRTSLAGLQAIMNDLVEKNESESLPHLVQKIAVAIDHFATRDGYDLRSIALLGWSEAQTNVEVREVMVPIYRQFLAQLRRAVKHAQRRGILDKRVPADAVASMLLSLLLGNVVQAALLGGNPTRKIAKGAEGLATIGQN